MVWLVVGVAGLLLFILRVPHKTGRMLLLLAWFIGLASLLGNSLYWAIKAAATT